MAVPVQPNAPTGAEFYNPDRACRDGWSAIHIGRPERPRHGCLEHLRTHEPGELSAREKKILEGIEDDMVTADPG